MKQKNKKVNIEHLITAISNIVSDDIGRKSDLA